MNVTKDRGMGACKHESMKAWAYGSMGVWKHGRMEVLAYESMGVRVYGIGNQRILSPAEA